MPISPNKPVFTPRATVVGLLAILSLVCGCEKQEQITTYTVPRHESLQTPEFLAESAKRQSQPARMLAAILPHGSTLWFFKLQGPPDDVTAREGEFHEFLKSLRFEGDSKIAWTLPETWKETPGNANRYATLVLNSEPPLEVTVTVLGAGDGELTQQLLDNINRWRGQLDLPHIEAEDLPQRTETINAGEMKVTVINIKGKAAPKPAMPGGMMPPMSGHPTGGESKPSVGASGKSTLQFDKPEGWTEVPVKQFQRARFTVGEGEQLVEVSVSRAGGGRDANINRWRGQLGLPPRSGDLPEETGKPFEAASRQGELIEIVAGEKALVVIVIPDGDQSWFIKLSGNSELATKERSNFEAFAKSLKL